MLKKLDLELDASIKDIKSKLARLVIAMELTLKEQEQEFMSLSMINMLDILL